MIKLRQKLIEGMIKVCLQNIAAFTMWASHGCYGNAQAYDCKHEAYDCKHQALNSNNEFVLVYHLKTNSMQCLACVQSNL